MSRLSSAEVKGCKQILSLLAAEDVLALTDTVTGRAITVTSIQEAVAAIVAYSNNAEEFLKRKKVHRDVIFKYLANEGVVTPANAEKHQLIKKTLELWSSGEKLLFCPNTGSQGLRCIASRHGLVAVAVAGTIHREHACLGIFEQVFGIIRAPLNKNSWKIKFIHLKIRGQNTLSGQEELTTPALTYSTSDLQLLCS
uniref:Uncharacterized protein n=1 Tax=Denticeps clupeoides TaxID=299321 RepID=A0AAY4E1B5_9TELE